MDSVPSLCRPEGGWGWTPCCPFFRDSHKPHKCRYSWYVLCRKWGGMCGRGNQFCRGHSGGASPCEGWLKWNRSGKKGEGGPQPSGGEGMSGGPWGPAGWPRSQSQAGQELQATLYSEDNGKPFSVSSRKDMIRFVVFYGSRLEREQRESTFVIILQIGRWFTFEATAELPGGGGELEYCWQETWEKWMAGNLLSRESHQWWGGLGMGNNRHCNWLSGFILCCGRDGLSGHWNRGWKWTMTRPEVTGTEGWAVSGEITLTLRCLRDLCVRWALGHRHSELWGEVWTRDDANQASRL